MSDVIGRCHQCELPIIEGESYHIYGGKTSHSNNQCAIRLKAQVDALRPDEGKLWSFLRSVLSQGIAINMDSAHFPTSEHLSIHLDSRARCRTQELLTILGYAPATGGDRG